MKFISYTLWLELGIVVHQESQHSREAEAIGLPRSEVKPGLQGKSLTQNQINQSFWVTVGKLPVQMVQHENSIYSGKSNNPHETGDQLDLDFKVLF